MLHEHKALTACIEPINAHMMMDFMKEHHIKIVFEVSVMEVTKDKVIYKDKNTNKFFQIKCNTIIMATGI